MKDTTESAERDLRKAVTRHGHELTALTVDEYEDEAIINLEVSVDLEEEKESQYRVN